MMRRIFTLLLAFVMVMTLAACGHGGGAETKTKSLNPPEAKTSPEPNLWITYSL